MYLSYTVNGVKIVIRYLAADMEEDDDDFKRALLPWALGNPWRKEYREFLKDRDALWRTLDYRAVVSCTTCHEGSFRI
jgi:hypothetical protein